MSRLFISHSSQDNVAAKAFKQWLCSDSWLDEDIFLDLDDIGAGERWKEALRKANTRCEAVILLATPEALSSPECIAEVRRAEDCGKEIIVVLLRDLHIEDGRLAPYMDRQIVNLSSIPRNHMETVEHRGTSHDVHFNPDALFSIKTYLFKRGISPNTFAWPPPDRANAAPYPGLTAFAESDAGIFFGRDADILRGLDKIRILRRDGRPSLFVIQAASGAGKSSFLRAGLWPRLDRDPDVATLAILRPATGLLTGPEGLGRALAARVSRPDHPINPGDVHAQLMAADVALAAAAVRTWLGLVAKQARERRRVGDKAARTPALLLAVDQAEKLLSQEDDAETKRFLALLARLPLDDVDLFVLVTIRTDVSAGLLKMIEAIGLEVPETFPLLPVSATSYRDVIFGPLNVLARGGRRVTITAPLVERLTTDAVGADALPLLAFTLSLLYQEFGAGDVIDIEHYERMGDVAGSIELALKRALAKPTADPAIPMTREAQLASLRAAFIPWLARIDPETGMAVRRVARMADFPDGAGAMVKRLTEARLLVADRRAEDEIVEIAHESLLRQWPELQGWLTADGEDLKLVDGIEQSARQWSDHDGGKDWLVHSGARLKAAERVSQRADFRKRLGVRGVAYIDACRSYQRQRRLKVRAFAVALVAVLVLALLGGTVWRFERDIKQFAYWFRRVRGRVLTAEKARGLTAGESLQDCTDCPSMVVVPAGRFKMGSPSGQGDRTGREYQQHDVTIASSFGGQVRADLCRMGRLRHLRPLPIRNHRQMGTIPAAGHQCHVVRCATLCRLVVLHHRSVVPTSHRGGIRVRDACRNGHLLPLGSGDDDRARALRRMRPSNERDRGHACRVVSSQSIWPRRHDRKRLRVGRRLLSRKLHGCAFRRIGSVIRRLPSPCHARRIMAVASVRVAIGGARLEQCRGPARRPWLSRRANLAALERICPAGT